MEISKNGSVSLCLHSIYTKGLNTFWLNDFETNNKEWEYSKVNISKNPKSADFLLNIFLNLWGNFKTCDYLIVRVYEIFCVLYNSVYIDLEKMPSSHLRQLYSSDVLTPPELLHHLALPVEYELMEGFWCSRCLNDCINLHKMIGSFASGATVSLVAKI